MGLGAPVRTLDCLVLVRVHGVAGAAMALEKELFTLAEVELILGRKVSTLRKDIRTGKLPYVRLGRQLRIARKVLDTLIANGWPATAIKAQVQLIQQVMKEVMQKDEHYGVIPGTLKPSLLKSGAEKLCLTFRLDPQYDPRCPEVNPDKVKTTERGIQPD